MESGHKCQQRLKKTDKQPKPFDKCKFQYDKEQVYRLRKQKVELPFGHIKRNLGAGHFLLRGREGVQAEMSLLSSCFNMARMISIIGVPGLLAMLTS